MAEKITMAELQSILNRFKDYPYDFVIMPEGGQLKVVWDFSEYDCPTVLAEEDPDREGCVIAKFILGAGGLTVNLTAFLSISGDEDSRYEVELVEGSLRCCFQQGACESVVCIGVEVETDEDPSESDSDSEYEGQIAEDERLGR